MLQITEIGWLMNRILLTTIEHGTNQIITLSDGSPYDENSPSQGHIVVQEPTTKHLAMEVEKLLRESGGRMSLDDYITATPEAKMLMKRLNLI